MKMNPIDLALSRLQLDLSTESRGRFQGIDGAMEPQRDRDNENEAQHCPLSLESRAGDDQTPAASPYLLEGQRLVSEKETASRPSSSVDADSSAIRSLDSLDEEDHPHKDEKDGRKKAPQHDFILKERMRILLRSAPEHVLTRRQSALLRDLNWEVRAPALAIARVDGASRGNRGAMGGTLDLAEIRCRCEGVWRMIVTFL